MNQPSTPEGWISWETPSLFPGTGQFEGSRQKNTRPERPTDEVLRYANFAQLAIPLNISLFCACMNLCTR